MYRKQKGEKQKQEKDAEWSVRKSKRRCLSQTQIPMECRKDARHFLLEIILFVY